MINHLTFAKSLIYKNIDNQPSEDIAQQLKWDCLVNKPQIIGFQRCLKRLKLPIIFR